MEPLLRLRKIHCIFGCQNFIFAKFERKNLLNETCGFLMGNRSLDLRDARSSTLPPDNRNTVSVFNESEIWVTYINNVLSNKTILFENCSCFSKIPVSISVESPRIFQGLISIPAGHWVRQINGKSSAIYLADPFYQHYSALWSAWQEDPNDPQERCAMARTSRARLWEINFACECAICS